MHIIERIVCFVASMIVIVGAIVQSGFLTYVSHLSNLPVVVFSLVLFADFILEVKRPKFAGDNGGL